MQGNSRAFDATISGDGRSVAFTTDATNLVPGDATLDFVVVSPE